MMVILEPMLDRRSITSRGRRLADSVTREEFDSLKEIVEVNRRNLQIQFERIAQMQMQLDKLTFTQPPRFKP
jgi:BMFP domain-containing protein YqiC